MTAVKNADAWAHEAAKLADKAKSILGQSEISAEDEAQFHKLRDAANEAFNRSEAMVELSNMKEKAIAQFSATNTEQTKADHSLDTHGGFKNLGEFFRSVFHLRTNHVSDDRLHWFNDGDGNRSVQISSMKALAENTGATGGVLVPAEFDNRLLSLMENEAIVWPRAERIRMERRTIDIPVVDQTGTTVGTPSWFGGVTGSWVGEATQLDEESPTFRSITLEAQMFAVYTRVSEQLLSDSAQSLEDFLMGSKGFPGLLMWRTDRAFLRGDGVAKPQGIIGSGAAITIARAGAGAVAYADLTDMLTNFLPSGNGVWVAHQSIMNELLQMTGPAGNVSFLWGSAVTGVPNTLLGLPIIFTDRVPILGTEGDIGLYDMSYYLIGDRQMTTVDVSKDERFQWVQTSFRATMRVDGKPWLSAPLTYEDGSTTVSPFVVLTDAS